MTHSAPAPRKIVLCADDYGLSPGVSRGIRELLANGRISATSCMVVYPEFAEDGPLLNAYSDAADIGLHFTLTADRTLGSVLRDGWLRRLNARAMWDEVERQVELFVSVMRRPPDYIDGHQHVHLLPAVREAVVGAASKIGAYVRLTREPINAAMLRRPAAIDSVYLSWASGALGRLARAAGIRANSGFRGARTFRDAAPFRDLFRSIIANATNGSIVMCHPGHVDDSLAARDSVTYTREEELAYLLGDDLHRDLAASGLRVTRLGEALS